MTTFSVKNFEKFQHYKDRTPPWIKLYNELLDDYEFGRLPDASKMHLVAIWLLASRYENQVPHDAEWVSRRINATEPVDLDLLAERGFIEVNQGCSNVLAERKQNAMPERETERETEEDTSSDLDEAYGLWNDLAEKYPNLPKANRTKTQTERLRACLKRNGMAEFRRALSGVDKSPWHQNAEDWNGMCLGWLTEKQRNFEKMLAKADGPAQKARGQPSQDDATTQMIEAMRNRQQQAYGT